MDTYSKIIRLGKTKSPSHARVPSLHDEKNREPASTSREQQPLNEAHHMNQTMYVKSRNVSPQVNFSRTNPNFYPIQQIKIQENINHRVIQQPPYKQASMMNVIVMKKQPEGIENLGPMAPDLIGQRQQLLRKNRVLETRIKELHEQKNDIILKTNENRKKLIEQNEQLRKKLSDFQNLKNQYASLMKKQLNILGGASKPLCFEQPQKTTKPQTILNNKDLVEQKILSKESKVSPLRVSCLKNSAYIYHEHEELTSICMQMSRKDQSQFQECFSKKTQFENENLSDKIKQLEELNKNLQENLDIQAKNYLFKQEQLKQSFLSQELMWKFKQNQYQKQLSQKNEYKEKVQTLQAVLEVARENNQYYVQKILKSSQQSMKSKEQYIIKINNMQSKLNEYQKQFFQTSEYKEKIQTLQAGLEVARENNQFYVQKLLKFSQQSMRSNEQYIIKINNLNQIISKKQQQARNAEQKIKKMETGVQENPGPKQCLKCRELIKTLVKLNQKVCTKTF